MQSQLASSTESTIRISKGAPKAGYQIMWKASFLVLCVFNTQVSAFSAFFSFLKTKNEKWLFHPVPFRFLRFSTPKSVSSFLVVFAFLMVFVLSASSRCSQSPARKILIREENHCAIKSRTTEKMMIMIR